jgi:CheY-like chemotaxis protein
MEGRYVLAIEHDWRMRKLIRANLQAVGLAVREAISPQQGLDLLREALPALVLLDLDMPGVDALHLLGSLEAQLSRHSLSGRQLSGPPVSGQPVSSQTVPVIVMSAEPPERWLLEHHLATSHLLKPFAATALLQQVRGALDTRAVDG